MASEQLSRRENKTTERDVNVVEKDRVPKMATHFEHLSVKEVSPPLGSLEPLQGGEINKDHAGKAIGDIGGRGKARETRELGSNVDHSLASARVPAKMGNVAENRVGERDDFGGVRDVGKFQMESKGGEREKLDRRTKVVTGTGTPGVKEQNFGIGKGNVVAESGRNREDLKTGERNSDGLKIGEIKKGERIREELKTGERKTEELKTGERNREGAKWEKSADEESERAKEEEEKRLTMEEISKYRNKAQQSAMEAISAAQEKYEKAKKATDETVTNTAQTAQEKTSQAMEKAAQAKDVTIEKAAQAKDVTVEKGQKGYEATKETVSNAAKTAAEKAAQAKDVTVEKGQQGYEATKETVSSAAKTAVEYASPVAEKAKYVAVDLKEKATVAGWTAANYSTQLTVDGTKAVANVVEGAAGYAGHKAAELAAKSVDVVKGLAASAGETAKEFTARKKEESWREYEAKRASQPLEGEERLSTEGIGENVRNSTQKMMPSGERTQNFQGTNEKSTASNVMSSIGETVGNIGEKVKKPFENMTSSKQEQRKSAEEMKKKPIGSDVLGAVTETVSDIGSNMMKSTDNKVNLSQEGQGGGGVLDAIGETIAEIAHTTKVIVVGEDGEEEIEESMKNIGSENRSVDRAKHEGHQTTKNVY